MSDNYFKQCPAVMSDGRLFTDYKTATRLNEGIKNINGIRQNDDYRLFLQSNAESIMNNRWNYTKAKNLCWLSTDIHNYPTRMDPSLFIHERKSVDRSFNMPRKCDRSVQY